jgi:hypothetical protein
MELYFQHKNKNGFLTRPRFRREIFPGYTARLPVEQNDEKYDVRGPNDNPAAQFCA